MARGDEQFVEFAQACSARLLHAAYLLTGDPSDAEDLTQTTLAKVFVVWHRVRTYDRPDAYARLAQEEAELLNETP